MELAFMLALAKGKGKGKGPGPGAEPAGQGAAGGPDGAASGGPELAPMDVDARAAVAPGVPDPAALLRERGATDPRPGRTKEGKGRGKGSEYSSARVQKSIAKK